MLRFAGCVLFALGCAHVPDRPPWISEAQPYIEADVGLFLSRPDEATIAPLVKAKEEVREALAQTIVPSRADVLAALDSNDEGTRRAALVFAIVHRWVDDEVLSGVISHYDASGAFFSRYYSMRVLMLAEPARIRQHSREISQLLMSEPDEGPRQIAMTFAPWLERRDALSVLLLYMRTGSPTLQRAGWAAAQATSKEFVGRLRLELRQRGYHDALRVMDLLDSGQGR